MEDLCGDILSSGLHTVLICKQATEWLRDGARIDLLKNNRHCATASLAFGVPMAYPTEFVVVKFNVQLLQCLEVCKFPYTIFLFGFCSGGRSADNRLDWHRPSTIVEVWDRVS